MKTALSYKFGEAGVEWWVAHTIPGCSRGFGPCYSLGVKEDDKLIGGIVFHNHNPEAGVIEMSAAAESPRWFGRKTQYLAHDFIFNQLSCQMAVMRVSERNERALRLIGALGYRGTLIPRLRGRNEAEWLLTLTDDAWRNSKWSKMNG